jgi:hypothetical protein
MIGPTGYRIVFFPLELLPCFVNQLLAKKHLTFSSLAPPNYTTFSMNSYSPKIAFIFQLKKEKISESNPTHTQHTANPSASFTDHVFCTSHSQGTWLLPHLHTREPKQHPRALPTRRAKKHASKTCPKLH